MGDLLGTMLALLLGVFYLSWAFPLYLSSQIEPIQNGAMTSINLMLQAAKDYRQANSAALVASTLAAPVAVTPAQLITAKNLSSGFTDSNPYGQSHIVVYHQPSAGQVEGMVYSYGGSTIPDQDLLRIAQTGPEASTVVLSTNSTNFELAVGGLTLPAANFTVAGYSISAGHAGAFIPPAAYSTYQPYLARYDTGNTEDRTMHADILANSNSIQGIATAYMADGVLTSNGNQSITRGVYWSGVVNNGTVVPWPTCPSGTNPQIFVNQGILSDNGPTNSTVSAIQAWATPGPGSAWTVQLRVQSEVGLTTPDSSHGQAPAYTKCG